MHSYLCSLPDLEADELEPPASRRGASALQTGLVPTSALGLLSPDSDSARDHPSEMPLSPMIDPPPYSERFLSMVVESSTNLSHSTMSNEEKSASSFASPPAPPSPASSLSSLPPQDPSMDQHCGPVVPISQILQAADRLRSRFPITDKKLRLEETLGPNSALRTWSSDPNEILEDNVAEEAVVATDQVVFPDLDDDVFELYPPPVVEKPVSGRLALLPKLDMTIMMSVGIPVFAAAALAFASSSPTARAHAHQAASWAYNFAEVGLML